MSCRVKVKRGLVTTEGRGCTHGVARVRIEDGDDHSRTKVALFQSLVWRNRESRCLVDIVHRHRDADIVSQPFDILGRDGQVIDVVRSRIAGCLKVRRHVECEVCRKITRRGDAEQTRVWSRKRKRNDVFVDNGDRSNCCFVLVVLIACLRGDLRRLVPCLFDLDKDHLNVRVAVGVRYRDGHGIDIVIQWIVNRRGHERQVTACIDRKRCGVIHRIGEPVSFAVSV